MLRLRAGQCIARSNEFDEAVHQGDPGRIVTRQGRVGTLAALRHAADGGNGTNVVVPPLEAPGGDGGIVHGASQGEVGLHVPFQAAQLRALAAEPLLQGGVVVDIVQDREPMAGRRLRVGAVGPEFGQHAGVVGPRNPLGTVRPAGVRVHLVSVAGVAACKQVEKGRIGLDTARQRGEVADRRR